MRIAITGSIATDYLMRYPGTFTDQLLGDSLDKVSLSFLVDDLEIRPGGVAANISYGLARLGLAPLLIGAVGADYAEHRTRLGTLGVDTEWLHVSPRRHTARFLCTTDSALNQMASFYPGAMSEAREIPLASILDGVGGVNLVVIAPNDPAAMLDYTAACRAHGYRFAADPSQQLPRFERDEVRSLIVGAQWLFTNEYERELLLEHAGWTVEQVLAEVGHWITTLGADGVRIDSRQSAPITVPAVAVTEVVDPTGAGDAFRAGFLAAVGAGADLTDACRIGAALASVVLETPGPQNYPVVDEALGVRLAHTYGAAAKSAYHTVRKCFSTQSIDSELGALECL